MESHVFVTRERELGQLDGFLNRALDGRGQICFVTGEAGSGKTALITEFARRVQAENDDLIVTVGQSDAQTGVGDAYLPFREMLSQLTGDVEAELARGAITQENANRLRGLLNISGEVLVEFGPDLVGIFVPGGGLALRFGGYVAEKAGWLEKLEQLTKRYRDDDGLAESGIEQSHIFEQYTNVLKALAVKQPLMLVLDDLQWADGASINLLFRLGRRLDESRILIVGTYRPDEVALGRAGQRHPLEKVLAEFKRYFGDISVDLGEAQKDEGEHFIDAFVDTEPNLLGTGFRQALYHHTGGHPLFTIELLREMQGRGDLIRDKQKRWVEGPVLDWESLPARVEGVIKERIGRLEEELREALSIGSVEGENFTAEVIARVQVTDHRALIRQLSGELEKRHRLVRARGVRRLDRQRLSLYRFQHNLFQTYLYTDLDDVERTVIHEDIGFAMEELYGDQVDDIAVQLAHHFVNAGIAEKASEYLRRAGELAAARYANDEAVDFLSRALDLTPVTESDQLYALLLARERVYDLQGERETQRQDLVRLDRLAQSLGDASKCVRVALRRANYAEVVSNYKEAIEAVQAAVDVAEEIQDVESEAAGHLRWGKLHERQGAYETALYEFNLALTLAQRAGLRDQEANILSSYGAVFSHLGDYEKAKDFNEQALRIFREIGDRRGEGSTLNNIGTLFTYLGDYEKARIQYEQALVFRRQLGDRRGESSSLSNLAIIYARRGEYTQAVVYLEQCLMITREIGDQRGEGIALQNLGDLAMKQGDYAGAKVNIELALDIFRSIGERGGEVWVLSSMSQLSHHLVENAAGQEYAQQALAIARQLGHRHLQGEALTYMGHCMVSSGHPAEAIEAYQEALDIRKQLGEESLAMETIAGLARASVTRNDLDRAQTYVEEIVDFLKDSELDGPEEPIRIYLTCYRVLQANQDPRAIEMLNSGHRLLREQADRISDEKLQRSFLKNVIIHQEILSEWTKNSSKSCS